MIEYYKIVESDEESNKLYELRTGKVVTVNQEQLFYWLHNLHWLGINTLMIQQSGTNHCEYAVKVDQVTIDAYKEKYDTNNTSK